MNRHQAVLGLKRLVYGRRGEPFRLPGVTLRYAPGTRPVRARYARASNEVARYDALQVRWFSTHLQAGDVALDVGAHAGQYALIMAAMCGHSGRVIAFEPDPYARQMLSDNVALNPAIKPPVIEPCAVSEICGEVSVFTCRGNSQSSLARGALFGADGTFEEVRVPSVTLDSYLEGRHIPVPRWVKIDVEGAEIRVMSGAWHLLRSDAGILCELHPYAWPAFGNTFAELQDLVVASGRRMRYLDSSADAIDPTRYGVVLLERVS